MQGKIKIDYDFISTWNPKYDDIANDEIEYGNLVTLVKADIEQKRTLSKATFIRILNWKAARVKGIVKLDDFDLYEKGIADTHSAEEEKKLNILQGLDGIGTPVGSTILHFMYPNIFPIMDIRTAETLHYAGRIESKSTSFTHYTPFKAEILKIRKENPGFSLREIDRALFAYHKIYLEPKLQKSQKNITCNRLRKSEDRMESFCDFTARLSRDVGCYYHHTSKAPLYSLKKYHSDEQGKMGVFCWVSELKRSNEFKIDTYWYLAEKASVAHLADVTKDGMHYISKKNDPEGKGTGISIFVKNGSIGEDYQKAVRVLKAVRQKIV